jgi:hypothetical protein
MRETTSRGWQRWRIAVVKSAPPVASFDLMTRLTERAEPAVPISAVSPDVEPVASDGIRHELVARIRQQIADGTYDTEEKWLLAEEALLRRIAG